MIMFMGLLQLYGKVATGSSRVDTKCATEMYTVFCLIGRESKNSTLLLKKCISLE